jgi:hypothetical protein
MRFSLIYDDVQAALVASKNPNHLNKPLPVGDSDSDSDMSHEKADRQPTEPAERLRPVRPQK